jgi:hypothetical protein
LSGTATTNNLTNKQLLCTLTTLERLEVWKEAIQLAIKLINNRPLPNEEKSFE